MLYRIWVLCLFFYAFKRYLICWCCQFSGMWIGILVGLVDSFELVLGWYWLVLIVLIPSTFVVSNRNWWMWIPPSIFSQKEKKKMIDHRLPCKSSHHKRNNKTKRRIYDPIMSYYVSRFKPTNESQHMVKLIN